MPEEATLFALRRLTYSYPDSAEPSLRDITLQLDRGVIALTGDSGSGKSTLLRTCNGIVPHFHGGRISGAARLAGHDVLRTPTRRLATIAGLLFQDPELQSVYATVERDVAFGLENLGVAPTAMRARVDEALQRTGIQHLRHRAVHTLSGGERQRCALAGVLALRPRLLALDEPFSQLDEEGGRLLRDTLAAIRDEGTAILLAEHRMAGVLPLCDERIHLARGALGDPDGTDDRDADCAYGAAQVTETSLSEPAPHDEPSWLLSAHRQDSTDAVWELRNVSAGHHGAAVVHDVSAAGSKREVVALVGPNGAGKTTLLRTIAGLLPPVAGSARRPPGRIAYLPQNPASLLHRATVGQEVAWTLRHDPRIEPGAAHRAVESVLAELRIAHLRDRYPRDLSAGEQQRIALAAVLAGRPAIALLDEPTRGMDRSARAALIAIVRRLRRDGCSVLIATHDRDLTGSLADRTLLVSDGGVRALQHPVPVPA